MKVIDKPIEIKLFYGGVKLVDEDKEGEECVIYDLFVKDVFRHRGLGTSLVISAVNEAIYHGYRKIFVVLEDEKLRKFYKRIGFADSKGGCKNEMYYYRYIPID